MSAEDDNPILKALPPETDYITYLTILEYQLTEQRLPSLLQVLQDDTLTENIGWDLVHLLIPMLPASRSCLDVISRKGNPREVIIRVTELLDALDPDGDEDELRTFEGEAERIHLGNMVLDGMPDQQPLDPSHPQKAEHEVSSTEAFEVLLSMLSILHPRIKTKFPSRFLATSLPAALAAYRRIVSAETTLVFLDFLTKVSGRQKPTLPPRGSDSDAPSQPAQVSLPDPEADVSTQAISAEEKALIQRLIQAVILEICEDYATALGGQPSGLSWSVRVGEELFPNRIIPGKVQMIEQFKVEGELKLRDAVMTKIMDLSLLLNLQPSVVLESLIPKEEPIQPSEESEPDSPKEYPTDPKDIPFSVTGSVTLLAAYASTSILQPAPQIPVLEFQGLATLSQLNSQFMIDDNFTGNPDFVIDALLAINLIAITTKDIAGPALSSTEFSSYLSPLIFLSADSPDAQVRNSSHLIVTKALSLHPDSKTVLSVIKTYLNIWDVGPRLLLRGSAIGWLKDLIIARQQAESGESQADASPDWGPIADLLQDVFWDIPNFLSSPNGNLPEVIAPMLSNVASALNFYYFLSSSPLLKQKLQLTGETEGAKSPAGQRIDAFLVTVSVLLEEAQKLDEEIKESIQRDVMVVELCLESVKPIG